MFYEIISIYIYICMYVYIYIYTLKYESPFLKFSTLSV